MQEITVEMKGPHSETSCTREHRYAYGERGGRIDLNVSRDRGVYTVTWNVDRGRGWQAKNWKASGLTQEKAEAFAEKKWGVLVDWLKNMEPVSRGDGAAAAFSAQVATMTR